MWLSRKNSNSINRTPTSPSRRSNFNRHSFKNIDDLLTDDEKKGSSGNDHQKPKQKPSKPSSPVSKSSSPVSKPSSPASKPSSPVSKPSSPASKPSSPAFKTSSPASKPSSPASPTPASTAKSRQPIFQRVRLANQFTRSIKTGRAKPNPNKSQIKNAPSKHKSEPFAPISINKASSTHKSDPSAPLITNNTATSAPVVNIPGSEKRVVVYMTSLGAVRPTFDACRAVRSILQGFRVAVDERDLSMDSSFKDELQKIMSNEEAAGESSIDVNHNSKLVGLPRVFIGGRYVGDADDMRELNETGELKKMVERLPAVSRAVCEGCGDFRFVICSDCNGSRKCYLEKGVFRSCMACNKNGLIRCPTCC
ncbi:hypothetical protein R6Q59_033166 [Mikania micrantha]